MGVTLHEAGPQEAQPDTGLGWREKLVLKFLLLAARLIAKGVELEGGKMLSEEIRHLENHIALHT